ncbi:MAG: alpha/beta hydrolase [Phycisphaeraceae bacterium]
MTWIILRILIFFVLAWWALLYVMQDRVMFPRDLLPKINHPAPPPQTVVLTRPIEGGNVEAWYVPAPDASAQHPAPLIVFFHGNAELIDMQDWLIDMYRPMGVSLLLVEFRGYGRSAGHPSQKAFHEDAAYFVEQVLRRPEVDGARLVYHGRSLGAAIAADLVKHRQPAAMIMQSTFASGAAMAHGFAAPGFLMRNPFRTDRALAGYNGPVLLLHGAHDSIIPVKHSRRLIKIIPHAKLIEYNSDHNDFPGMSNVRKYENDLRAFLTEHGIIKDIDE